ncbi:MAG: hypothetical protein FD126_3197, partial [Elusimicrobia bacterium]
MSEEDPEEDDNFGARVGVVLLGLTALVMVPWWGYKMTRPPKDRTLQQGFGVSKREPPLADVAAA